MERRVAPRRRCAPDTFACSRSIRLAATVRLAMTRAALLGSVWLGALAAFATDDAHAQQGPFLYVPNNGSASVTIIDTPTSTTVPPAITIGTQPITAAVRGDESLAYVTNFGSNSVSVINTGTNAVVTTINVGTSPTGIAVSPDGTRAYVTQTGNNVSVIDTTTNTVVTTLTGFNAPAGVAFSPDGTRVYVTNVSGNNVSVIDTATNAVVGAPIAVGSNPNAVAFSPDGTRAYVTNQNSGTVSVINTATNTVVATVGVGTSPRWVAVSPDGTRAYVANNGNNTVSVINTATNTVVTNIGGFNGPQGVVFSPDGTRAYVTNNVGGNVSVIDTANNTVLGTIPAGNNPDILGVCSNGNALLASGRTFKANTSGALACTLASGASGASGPVFTGGTLQIAGANIASALPVTLQSQGGTIDTNGNNATLSGAISGPGSLTKIGAGTLTLSGSSTYTGATNVNAGTLQAGATNAFSPFSTFTVAGGATLALAGFSQTIGSLAGAGAVTLGSSTLTTGNDNTSTTFSGTISGTGSLTKIGTGALTLSGSSSYSGATAVNAGTLIVNGSIASSAVTVNSGSTLAGTGTVGATTIMSGGTFAPGNSPGTMTIAGNLAFQSGALYLVQVTSTTASSTNVTGSATLAGTVQAAFAAGSYATRAYTILSATGGLGGTTFNTLTTSNLPAGFTASLSYTATDAILNLTANLGSGTSGPSAIACAFSVNQCNVANALNAFFNNGGALPPAFVTIFGLTGANLANALTLLSGEAATGAQQGAFQLTNQFLGIMLDPFVDGRSGASSGGAIGFAPAREELPEDIALAYAKILKEPPSPSLPSPASGGGLGWGQRWSVWGAGYGGANRTSGDPAVVGSHDLSAATAGGAAGLDYRLAPGTVVGFALAGAGTNWGLAQGLGGGKSDAFQAGVYGTTRWGPTYVAAALAFTNHWMSTDRFAFAADHLTASFNAQSFGGRVESGYRIATLYGGLTPYAAIQAQNFRTPSYSEADLTSGGFALGYNSRNATDTRSELGGRFDRLLLLNPEAALTLRTRVAWAHDWISDPSLAALFQTLPGASFVVNGATPAKNSALTSAGAELRLANGVVLLAKFDGEFASHASTYAGTGRYTW
jgi:YVTN family beta-propeller protein/autotransporter-associated beta strand protein